MAMKMQGLALEQWRDYFNTAKSDIFDIIEHAMIIAALDYPTEFRLQRDQIAEKLFTYTSTTRCSDCDNPVESLHSDNAGGSKENKLVLADNAGGSKESKTSNLSSGTGDDPLVNQFTSNFSYGDAEALTDEIEQEVMIVGEVLRIKDVLLKSRDELSDSELFDSLRRLQLMVLTIDNLKATEIGKAVNRFRKHSSEKIRQLAQTLITGWKEMVDEWVSATEALVDTPESVNPSKVEEEEEEEEEGGLPSPPLDEGYLFSAQPTSMEFSEFFDGMDDDGNPRSSGEYKKNRDSGRKPSEENHNLSRRKQQTSSEANMVAKDAKSQQMKRLEPVAKANNKPSNTNTVSGRPTRNNMEQKPNTDSKLLQKSDKMAVPKKPLSSQQYEFKTSDEVSVQRKLEDTKRKLQERYQQAENAKKKRTIQIMELRDLPKQASCNKKNSYLKPGSRIRQLLNGRR